MIHVKEVTQHYGVRPVLRRLTLTIERGELMAVVGPNGMGKSTLLKVVAGVLWPQSGSVEIGGLRRRASAGDELAIRQQVVYLPDQPWLPRDSTGREFLLAVGRIYGIDDARLMDHIDRLLELFDLGEHGDSPLRTYSHGQQKKAAICAALVTEAPVMVLDEPFTGGLDSSAILALTRVMQLLSQRKDVTVLLATQLPEVVEKVAHRVAVIRDGELLACATPVELRRSAGNSDTLAEALESLVHPETTRNIERYLLER